jgi:anti-sigma factor ChrR (cupin superfamily)
MSGRAHQDIFASDIEWRPGTDQGVSYARFLLDAQNASAPMVILSKFEPGVSIAPHTHDTNYFEYIIDGEQTVGKVTFGTGDVRIVKGGTGYGPITIGPDGCTVLIVFEHASRAITVPLPNEKSRRLVD